MYNPKTWVVVHQPPNKSPMRIFSWLQMSIDKAQWLLNWKLVPAVERLGDTLNPDSIPMECEKSVYLLKSWLWINELNTFLFESRYDYEHERFYRAASSLQAYRSTTKTKNQSKLVQHPIRKNGNFWTHHQWTKYCQISERWIGSINKTWVHSKYITCLDRFFGSFLNLSNLANKKPPVLL